MDINGQQFIDAIVNRLKDEGSGHRLFDSVIMNKLRTLNNGELNQIVSFGDVIDWHNERVLKERDVSQNAE